MRHVVFDTGNEPARIPTPRRSSRVELSAEIILRRPGQRKYSVNVYDVSCHGCRVEFVELPRLDERVWIKFDGLEAMEALVCWVKGHVGGVEFERAIHPAVFDMLIARLRGSA